MLVCDSFQQPSRRVFLRSAENNPLSHSRSGVRLRCFEFGWIFLFGVVLMVLLSTGSCACRMEGNAMQLQPGASQARGGGGGGGARRGARTSERWRCKSLHCWRTRGSSSSTVAAAAATTKQQQQQQQQQSQPDRSPSPTMEILRESRPFTPPPARLCG